MARTHVLKIAGGSLDHKGGRGYANVRHCLQRHIPVRTRSFFTTRCVEWTSLCVHAHNRASLASLIPFSPPDSDAFMSMLTLVRH